MSGGHFRYLQHGMDEQVHELRRIVRCVKGTAAKDEREEDGSPVKGDYDAVTTDIIARTATLLETTRKLLHAVDYLVCGDSGEDEVKRVWTVSSAKLAEVIRPTSDEVVMRLRGWMPAEEYLAKFEDEPGFRVLKHVEERLADMAAETLRYYATRPAFFNTRTGDLMEIGGWEDLRRAVE